jgi:hypothetical protein
MKQTPGSAHDKKNPHCSREVQDPWDTVVERDAIPSSGRGQHVTWLAVPQCVGIEHRDRPELPVTDDGYPSSWMLVFGLVVVRVNRPRWRGIVVYPESVVKTRSECDCSPYFTQLSLWLLCPTES